MKTNVCAVILAAGSGSRMGTTTAKQHISILGETILHRALRAFDECDLVNSIVVVSRENEYDIVEREISDIKKIHRVVIGGKTRFESAFLGFKAIPDDTDFVAIHDSARCLISPCDIARVIRDAETYGAATASRRVTDTVKKVDSEGFISSTENREFVRMAQTPQIFKKELYLEAVSSFNCENIEITDDNMLLEMLGTKVFCTDIGSYNIKITYPEDVRYAEFLLKGEVL